MVQRQGRRARRLSAGLVVVLAGIGLAACNNDAGTGLWVRDVDPVVVTGANVSDLVGTGPGDIVGFRFDTDVDAWDQVPVQVDERHVEDLAQLRNGSGTSGHTTLAYSDATDNAGADPNGAFDTNDEIAFMADDTGGLAPGGAGYPAGVVAGSGVRVKVTDPLATGEGVRGSGIGYVYLFERSGSLPPGAGANYVTYTFGPVDPMGHAENSTLSTPRYATHFAARWTRDRITIKAPAGTGVDLLDRHKNLFAPGNCGRSEDTFSAGEGGYATNKDGVVRAIRSYLGANSGTYTQREHIFYRETERVQTFLRVHAIPGIMDYYDYSPAADGMIYTNNFNTGGLDIDGVPETPAAGAPSWEAVSGDQGAIIAVSSIATDITPFAAIGFYSDDSTPRSQCTGDAFEYGASGSRMTSDLPNTDPGLGPTVSHLTATRWNVYLPADNGPGAPLHFENITNPLTTAVAPY